MIRKLLTVVVLLVVLSIGIVASFERWSPIENYLDYVAVVSYPAYTKSKSVRFISVIASSSATSFRQWDDSIWCRPNDTTPFEQADFYLSSVTNKPAYEPYPTLVKLAMNEPADERLIEWRQAIIDESRRLGKGKWKFQLSMDWPTQNTACYGKHTITTATPVFQFRRSKTVYSQAFWLIGSDELRPGMLLPELAIPEK